MTDAYEDNELSNFRTAAYVVSIQRVADSFEESGSWP